MFLMRADFVSEGLSTPCGDRKVVGVLDNSLSKFYHGIFSGEFFFL